MKLEGSKDNRTWVALEEDKDGTFDVSAFTHVRKWRSDARPVEHLDPVTGEAIARYPSMYAAAKAVFPNKNPNSVAGAIRSVCCGNVAQTGGHTFRFSQRGDV